MLFIYLLERNPTYFGRVQWLLERSYAREDRLFTSFLGLGEVMAGAARSTVPGKTEQIRALIDEMGFSYLPFAEAAVYTFARLRAIHRVKSADAIHLASAAAAGIDLFLTGDQELTKLSVPGIYSIADFDSVSL
jgi:uncharacterized protein